LITLQEASLEKCQNSLPSNLTACSRNLNTNQPEIFRRLTQICTMHGYNNYYHNQFNIEHDLTCDMLPQNLPAKSHLTSLRQIMGTPTHPLQGLTGTVTYQFFLGVPRASWRQLNSYSEQVPSPSQDRSTTCPVRGRRPF
jgi:hypothetical protein